MKSHRNIFIGLVCVGALSFTSCSGSAGGFPETCKDVQDTAVADTGKRPADGVYTLYVKGDESMPWEAFCRRMNLSEPTEYITVDEDSNFSESGTGTEVTTTSYRRYRIDPERLEIDPLDDTFAATEGDAELVPDGRDHIPAGWAQFVSAVPDDGPAARSKIDLSGTAFVFDESVLENNLAFFCTKDGGGDSSSSGTTVSSDLSKVTMTAINTIAASVTKTVADCDDLSADDQDGIEDFKTAAWPVQYVQE